MPPRADLVLYSGRVLTLDPAMPSASAIAFRDGRIVEVGTDEVVRAWAGDTTRTIDLEGRVAVPGLVDSHVHLANLGLRRFGVDLVGTKSIAEIKERVRAASADAKRTGWIKGYGWDQNDWERKKKDKKAFPSAKDLDEITSDRPIVLTRIDGHALWVNSAAMRLAGVTQRTKAPPGGEIIKQGGRPTGVFIDAAMSLIQKHLPPPTDDELRAALRIAENECLAAGLTAVHDMGMSEAALRVLESWDDAGELRLRVYAFADGADPGLEGVLATGPRTSDATSKSRLTVRGVKYYLDGALGSRGAALLAPYSDERANVGLMLMTPEQIEEAIRKVDARGFQVALHAIGDRANKIALDAIGSAFRGRDARSARPRIEHAQVLRPEDVPRFASMGVIASMQPTHATSDMAWAEKRLGAARIKGAYAWKDLLTASATIAAGSDAPVEDISPILGLYAAITRKDLLGSVEEGWHPEQRMSALEALAAYTKGGAFASFQEDRAGSLRKGWMGDVTVLDVDPLTASEDELAGAQVQLTIVGGRIEFAREGLLPAPDETDPTAPSSESNSGEEQTGSNTSTASAPAP